jgi:hypothetical protein
VEADLLARQKKKSKNANPKKEKNQCCQEGSMISPRHAILGHTHAGGSIWPRLLAFGRRGKPKNPKLLRASFAYRGLAPSPPFTASGKKDALHSVRSLIGLLSDQSTGTED